MTALLEKAIEKASALPEADQEAIGALILEEIASESRWNAQFASSQDALARLGNEALSEFDEGKTLPFRKDSDLSHD
ncbi:MAG TPA: hypothetical protein VMF08_03550 [Candidatus Sulfotelmatobacter sp.]|nr:hypothetical protein [Candidatus Sulfotelmatobacter sp.]